MFLDGHYCLTDAKEINECKVELDKKKLDLDAHINELERPKSNRQAFYALQIGVHAKQSPLKIDMQKDQQGQLITTSS